MIGRIIAYVLFGFVFIVIVLAGYGSHQLYTRSDRLDLQESQIARIKHLELKVYEHERDSDYAEIIEQLNPLFQNELSLLNTMIRSEKQRDYKERSY